MLTSCSTFASNTVHKLKISSSILMSEHNIGLWHLLFDTIWLIEYTFIGSNSNLYRMNTTLERLCSWSPKTISRVNISQISLNNYNVYLQNYVHNFKFKNKSFKIQTLTWNVSLYKYIVQVISSILKHFYHLEIDKDGTELPVIQYI